MMTHPKKYQLRVTLVLITFVLLLILVGENVLT